MLIYENNNKLNINFDNEVSENPDLQIGKEDGKTEVLINGQPVGGWSVLVIPDTNEKVDLTFADPSVPGELRNSRGIIVDTEMDIGTLVVEAVHYQDSTVVEYGVPNPWSCALVSGVDPSLVFDGHYTFAGSRMAWVYIPTGGQHEPVVIIPPSFAKDLIPGTKKDPIT